MCKGLDGSAPDSYGSDIFSKLPFEDVKKAHTETVVPVTQEDFHNRKHFRSVDELQRYRATHSDVSSYDHEGRYKETKDNEEMRNKERMFKMLKQKEKMEKVQDQWWKVVKTKASSSIRIRTQQGTMVPSHRWHC